MDQPVAAEIVNLHKTFKTGLGKPVVHAVRGIDMNIRQGEVYGLIGPNGSGKSTLMKALLGLVRPTEGSCSIFGRSSLAPDSKEEVGFLPENPYFYKFLTGAETVSFYGRLCGLSGKSLKAKVRARVRAGGVVRRITQVQDVVVTTDRKAFDFTELWILKFLTQLLGAIVRTASRPYSGWVPLSWI